MGPLGMPFLLPFVLGVCLGLGVMLLILGWRGRVHGGEPRCRRCQYNLIGVTSPVCPECGLELLTANVTSGQRCRRPVMLGVGGLLLAPAAFGLIGAMWLARSQFNVTPHLPASWLISSAASGSDAALNELLIRLNDDKLSDSALRQFAEAALIKHGQSPAPARWAEWCDALARIDQRGLLSDAQKEQFYSQLFVFELKARSPIRSGDPVVYEVGFRDRTSEVLPYRYLLRVTEAKIGGTAEAGTDGRVRQDFVLNTDTRWQRRDPDRLNRSTGSRAEVPSEPGTQTFEIRAQVVLQPEDETAQHRLRVSDRQAHRTSDLHLATQVEVLPLDAPDPVEWISDEATDAAVRKSFARNNISIVPDEMYSTGGRRRKAGSAPDRYRVQWSGFEGGRTRSPPVTCAFQILAVVDGIERPSGSLLVEPKFVSQYSYGQGFRRPESGTVDVILRADKQLARETMDVFRIWQGEIRIENVPVSDEALDE